MPPSEQPANNPHWCAGWPMTLARIKNHQVAFTGAPSKQVPFAMHSVKYLLRLLERVAADAGMTLEDVERNHGNYPEPADAPWITNPRTDTWADRMRQYAQLPQCELTHAKQIPYGQKGQPADVGTERYPEWEGYEERRHAEGARPTDPEMADERQLREREQAAMDVGDETAKAIEDEAQRSQQPPDDEIENALGGMFD